MHPTLGSARFGQLDGRAARNGLPRFTIEARKTNQAVVDLVRVIGSRKGATPAQIAIAWLLAQRPWVTPIPGTTKLHRLEENIGAVGIELASDDVVEIERAASAIRNRGRSIPRSTRTADEHLT